MTDLRRFGRRLAGARGEQAVNLAGQAIRGVALGIVLVALGQAVLGGIGLFLAGVPFAAVLTALMFLFGIVQVGVVPVLATCRRLALLAGEPWMGHGAPGLDHLRRDNRQRDTADSHSEGCAGYRWCSSSPASSAVSSPSAWWEFSWDRSCSEWATCCLRPGYRMNRSIQKKACRMRCMGTRLQRTQAMRDGRLFISALGWSRRLRSSLAPCLASLLLIAVPVFAGPVEREQDRGAWRTAAPAAMKRTEVAAATVGDKIYLVGGFEEPSISNVMNLSITPACRRVRRLDRQMELQGADAGRPASCGHRRGRRSSVCHRWL